MMVEENCQFKVTIRIKVIEIFHFSNANKIYVIDVCLFYELLSLFSFTVNTFMVVIEYDIDIFLYRHCS